MRIGFATIYSWRPHIEHLNYLADMVRRGGHEAVFLTCNADLSTCYTRELRHIRPDWQECLLCRIGGVCSYSAKGVSSIGDLSPAAPGDVPDARMWSLSSASTLGRFESDADFGSVEFLSLVERLTPVVARAYTAATTWIESLAIDALVVFNGRIDVTRAIFEAAIAKNIPVASLERTWFGDGLQLLPQENCLGLRSVTQMVGKWAGKPLCADQARLAARLISSRFLCCNHSEWRAYNLDARILPWPVSDAKTKILLIPGSRNEIWGHPDWRESWGHPLSAYDALMRHFGWHPRDLVLRCHPNWAENIGTAGGRRAEEIYVQWAQRRGVTVIPSYDKASTLGLIEQSDAVVVASGSAALEAASLGKQVIGIAPANYQSAGIRDDATTPQKLAGITLRRDQTPGQAIEDEARVRMNALRFAYTIAYRVPQYVQQVRCVTPTRYLYRDDGDPERLIKLLRHRELEPDDATFSADTVEETLITELMLHHQWSKLMFDRDWERDYKPMQRRPIFRVVDFVRSHMRHGDR